MKNVWAHIVRVGMFATVLCLSFDIFSKGMDSNQTSGQAIEIRPELSPNDQLSLLLALVYGDFLLSDEDDFLIFKDYYSNIYCAYNFGAACDFFIRCMNYVNENGEDFSMNQFAYQTRNEVDGGRSIESLIAENDQFFVYYQLSQFIGSRGILLKCFDCFQDPLEVLAYKLGYIDWVLQKHAEQRYANNRKELMRAVYQKDARAIRAILQAADGKFFHTRHETMTSFLEEKTTEVKDFLSGYERARALFDMNDV